MSWVLRNPPWRFALRHGLLAVLFCDVMSTASAIIFDIDDTLYPERDYAFSGFAAVAEAFADRLGDVREAAARMRELFDTEHRRRVFDRFLDERGMSKDTNLVRRMIETYRAHQPAISLYPDADQALTRFSRTHKLGLITDGPARQQQAKIDALELPPRFDTIILTDELGSGFGKPHPKSFEMMADRLGVEPGCCVYVADNAAKDFVAPNALGWITVRIHRAEGIYRDAATASGGAAQHDIDRLDQLDAVLNSSVARPRGLGPTDPR